MKRPESWAGTLVLVRSDLRRKAEWCYQRGDARAVAKALLSDGTASMLLYRLQQSARAHGLGPLEALWSRLNTIFCDCTIGRGAELGPGFVLIHANGVVINGMVRGGSNILIEHQVTIGAERRTAPRLGSDIFIGAGAKILGSVTIGDGAKIGANAVVVRDVEAQTTVVGVPARPVQKRPPP